MVLVNTLPYKVYHIPITKDCPSGPCPKNLVEWIDFYTAVFGFLLQVNHIMFPLCNGTEHCSSCCSGVATYADSHRLIQQHIYFSLSPHVSSLPYGAVSLLSYRQEMYQKLHLQSPIYKGYVHRTYSYTHQNNGISIRQTSSVA